MSRVLVGEEGGDKRQQDQPCCHGTVCATRQARQGEGDFAATCTPHLEGEDAKAKRGTAMQMHVSLGLCIHQTMGVERPHEQPGRCIGRVSHGIGLCFAMCSPRGKSGTRPCGNMLACGHLAFHSMSSNGALLPQQGLPEQGSAPCAWLQGRRGRFLLVQLRCSKTDSLALACRLPMLSTLLSSRLVLS